MYSCCYCCCCFFFFFFYLLAAAYTYVYVCVVWPRRTQKHQNSVLSETEGKDTKQ